MRDRARQMGVVWAAMVVAGCADPLAGDALGRAALGPGAASVTAGVALVTPPPDADAFAALRPTLRLRDRIVLAHREGLRPNRCPTAAFVCTVGDGDPVDGALVTTFDGIQCVASGVADPDGDALTYKWRVEAPLGDGADLSLTADESAAQLDVIPMLHGGYRVDLDVTDGRCLTAAEPVAFDAASQADLVVELTWDSVAIATDLDLHVARQDDCWGDPARSCSAASPQPDWGVAGAADDPWMRRTDRDVRGAEVFELAKLEDNVRYDVGVASMADSGLAGAAVTVRVFARGERIVDESRAGLNPGWFWNVASVDAGLQLALIENRVDTSRAAANRARGLVCGQ